MKINISIYFKCALILTTVIAVFLTGCPAPIKRAPEELAMVRNATFSYPDFSDDLELDGLEHSILKSLDYLQKVPADRTYQFGKHRFGAVHLIKSLQHFLDFIRTNPSGRELKNFIRTHYRVYQSIGRDQEGEVLFTGYYEPMLEGSKVKTERFRYPVYRRPDDLLVIDLGDLYEELKGKRVRGRLQRRFRGRVHAQLQPGLGVPTVRASGTDCSGCRLWQPRPSTSCRVDRTRRHESHGSGFGRFHGNVLRRRHRRRHRPRGVARRVPR